MNLKIDPEFREFLPPLTPEEFKRLESSILKDGLLDAIKVWTDEKTNDVYIVDGHNRYNICLKNNIDIGHWQLYELGSYKYKNKNDVLRYMLETQLGRRNLTVAEKYEIIQKYKPLIEGKAKKNISSNGGNKKSPLTTLPKVVEQKVDTRKEMAKLVGTSEGTYAKLDKIFSSNNEELKRKVKGKEISINKAAQTINKKQNHAICRKSDEFKDKSIYDYSIGELSDTADCDKVLLELEQKQQQISEEQQKIYIIRQQLYDRTPDDDLHCEVEEQGQNSTIYSAFEHKYLFFLVKGKNKRFVIDFCEGVIEDSKKIQEWVSEIFTEWVKNKRITQQDKTVIVSKLFEINKELNENKEQRTKTKDEYWRRIDQGFKQNIIKGLEFIKRDPMVKDIINTGYKTLAKKYHPDITNDDGKQMQLLNDAKEALEKLVS